MNGGYESRRAFHIGDVLSLVTGFDVSLRGQAGYRALEEYVAGRSLSLGDRLAHSGRISQEVRRQFPELCSFDDEDVPPRELLHIWLARRAAEFGEYLVVSPLRSALREYPDPGTCALSQGAQIAGR